MDINVTITLTGCDFDMLQRVLGTVPPGAVRYTPSRLPRVEPEAEAEAEAAPVPTEIVPAAEPTEAAPAPAPTVIDGEPVAVVIARLDAKYKGAKTVTLKGGAQGKVDDEVIDEAGEVGIIAAVYRGRAVVEYEDGRGEEAVAATLTKVTEGSEPETKTEAPETEGAEGGNIKQRVARLIRKVTKAKGAAIVLAVLHEFEAEGFEDIMDDDMEELAELLEEELAAE